MPKLAIAPEERLLTAAAAAEILGLSTATVYNLMNASKLEYLLIGKSRRIRRSVVMALIEASEQRGPRGDWVSPRRRQSED